MLTRLTLRDGNAVLPLEDCKDYLRITHDDEDAQIGRLRDAAVAEVERVSGIALSQAEFRWTLPRFSEEIVLPVRPVIEVMKVEYQGGEGTISYSDWRVANEKVLPATGQRWPVARGFVAVQFSAGIADPGDEPELIASALRVLAHTYDNRGSEVPLHLVKEIARHRQVLV